jgi:hypothetical protein
MVGVIGFEPTTPSSRTIYTPPKLLKILEGSRRFPVNKWRNDMHSCAETVPADRDRLLALLRIAHEQYAHKSPEDQAHERRFMARDFAQIPQR